MAGREDVKSEINILQEPTSYASSHSVFHSRISPMNLGFLPGYAEEPSLLSRPWLPAVKKKVGLLLIEKAGRQAIKRM